MVGDGSIARIIANLHFKFVNPIYKPITIKLHDSNTVNITVIDINATIAAFVCIESSLECAFSFIASTIDIADAHIETGASGNGTSAPMNDRLLITNNIFSLEFDSVFDILLARF